MRNPRDLYIRSCFSAGLIPAQDYFAYTGEYLASCREKDIAEVAWELKNDHLEKVKECAGFLRGGKATDEWRTAYAIFSDPSMRILIDGMLLFFSVEDICRIKGFSRPVMDTYTFYFFNCETLQSLDTRLVFQSTIIEDAAQTWFRRCSSMQIDQFEYILTGKAAEKAAPDALKEMRHKLVQDFMVYGVFPVESLEEGLSKEHDRRIKAAHRAAALAQRMIGTELQFTDMLKSIKDFLQAFSIDVEQESLESFEHTNKTVIDENGTTVDDDLLKQYDSVSAVQEEDDESDLPESDIDPDD